jgi:DnaJ-class molecular chaperone
MDKAKAECVTCHHKDPQDPKACKTCHGSEAKGKTLSAKDAFHKQCQTCHKEAMAKGVKAPTKCNECHVK